jgi:hypothetical protein
VSVAAAVTESPADRVTPAYVPEIVTEPEVQAIVDTAKVALEAPAATVTLVGTVAIAESLLASSTTAPPAGAAALRITVPLAVFPALTLPGFRLSEERAAITATLLL